MATATGLSDDWQDVNDDSFSVVSIPSSDEGDQSPLTQNPTAENTEEAIDWKPVAWSAGDTGNNDTTLPVRLREPSSAAGQLHAESDVNEVERYGMDLKDAVESEEDDEDELEGGLNELLDVDTSPAFLCKVTTSLIKLLQEITGLLDFQANIPQLPNADDIKQECDSLTSHLQALEPVLTGYSKHWNADSPSYEIPLDPGLYECLSDLRIELLGLQALLQGHLQCGHSSGTTQPSADSHYTRLANFATQFAGFVPIMRSDYEEFHISHMKFLSINEAETDNLNHNPPPTGPSQLLRLEVYNLKDQIRDCVGEINLYLRHLLNEDRDTTHPFVGVHASYSALKLALDLILSNNPSDWLDHGLNGGLTYAMFHQLNPDTIRSLSTQLKDVVDDLGYHRRLANYSGGDLCSELTLAGTTYINSLRSIEEVLVSLFRIRPSPPPEKDQLDNYGERFMI
jgi:hypothetical protein